MSRLTGPPPSEAVTVDVAGYTHPGHQREDNEDALGIYAEERLFIVADGMGGLAAGETAARIAVDEIEAFFRTHRRTPAAAWPYPVDARVSLGANLLRVAMKVANRKIREATATDPDLRKMGSTIAALSVGDTGIVVAHVGDVRVYRLRGGTLSRLTRDHSIVEEMRAARPNMTADDIAALAPRNVVTRALGTKEEVEPTVYVNTFARGDVYLLCSDGLWSVIPQETIAEIVWATQDLEAAAQSLLDAANDAGGPDNVSAVLVRIS